MTGLVFFRLEESGKWLSWTKQAPEVRKAAAGRQRRKRWWSRGPHDTLVTMSSASPTPPSDGRPSSGQHLATISHEGRFWDLYLEFDEDLRRPGSYRGNLAFSPADRTEGEDVLRTIALIIEPSYDEAMKKARGIDEHQLSAFLRSLLP